LDNVTFLHHFQNGILGQSERIYFSNFTSEVKAQALETSLLLRRKRIITANGELRKLPCATPLKSNGKLHLQHAVNFPKFKSIALPMLRTSTLKGLTVPGKADFDFFS